MKKAMAILIVFVLVTAIGCKKENDKQPEPAENTATQEIKATPTPTPTQYPTPTPEPVADPTSTPEPEPASKDRDQHSYEDFLGTWYLNRGEIEGYEWTAEEEENVCRVVFAEDLTATRIREYLEADPDIETCVCTYGYDEYVDQFRVYADFGYENASFSFALTDDGELEEYGNMKYDGFEDYSYSVYTREPFWGDGDYYARYVKTLPETIRKYIDDAPENAWIVAIADPDAELSKACDEGNWRVVDETDNEWVNCPWNNPKELIIANSSDRNVTIEIHEPLEGFDPKSSETDWEAGPFMYADELKPGELCRFIVDMPEKSIDATMCMYMEFSEEERYYLRVFKYDNEDPYIIF